MLRASVIVCTYNRCESLRDTLRALKDQVVDKALCFEIIVVNNNSSDRTKETVQEVVRDNTRTIRYLFEPKQGKSFALNYGIKKASGELIAFTDDDTLPDPSWIRNLFEGLMSSEADCVGGPVLPVWAKEPPKWITESKEPFGMLGLLDRGKKPLIAKTSDENFLIGSNCAFRRTVLDEIGLFRTDLGRKGTSLYGGEDSEMIRRVVTSGKRVAYIPNAIVYHKVPAERMSVKYLRGWNFYTARSTVRMSKLRKGIVQALVIECIASVAVALSHYASGAKSKAVGAESNFWWKLGMLVELWAGSKAKSQSRGEQCQASA